MAGPHLIGARGAGEPMLPIRFAFPNQNALLGHMQKKHIAGLQRIEALAHLCSMPSTNPPPHKKGNSKEKISMAACCPTCGKWHHDASIVCESCVKKGDYSLKEESW